MRKEYKITVRDENRQQSIPTRRSKPRPTKMVDKRKSAEEKMSWNHWSLLTYPDYNHPRMPNRIKFSVVSTAKPSLSPSAEPRKAMSSPEMSRVEPRDKLRRAERAELQAQQRAPSLEPNPESNLQFQIKSPRWAALRVPRRVFELSRSEPRPESNIELILEPRCRSHFEQCRAEYLPSLKPVIL